MPGPGSQPAEVGGLPRGSCYALCVMQRWVTQGFDGCKLRDTGQFPEFVAASRVEYLSAVSTRNAGSNSDPRSYFGRAVVL